MAGQVRVVLQHSLVYEAGAARPVVFGLGVGDDGHKLEVGHCLHLGFDPIGHVQVGRAAPAPVQGGRALATNVLHVFNQRLDGGKASARGQQDHGLFGVFAQIEAAIRPFGTQDVFFFHGGKHRVGELAAGHVANMQLHDRGRDLQRVGRVGHAVAAT